MLRLEIFKTGRHTASGGQALTFSDDDLQRAVDAYDPKLHEAPIVVGHPRDNAPAYGWVAGLEFADGSVHATPRQVDPSFAEMVEAGRFKKRSASFYRPDAPTNPVPGTYYLRHVGFLGAQPPAVKGLADPQFHDHPDEVVEFTDTTAVATLFRRLREFIVDKFGTETADTTLPGFLVEDLEAEARRDSETEPKASYSEHGPPGSEHNPPPATTRSTPMQEISEEEVAALRAQAAKAEEYESRIASYEERERALERGEIAARVDALVAAGQVLPASKPALVDFLADLDATETVEFGDAEARQATTRRDFLERFLATLPRAVDYAERAGASEEPGAGASDREIADRAVAYREREARQGHTITTTQAVEAVRRGLDQH